MVEFSTRLKQLRDNKRLSREELAKAVQLSYWAIAKYETGERTPDPSTLQQLADYFTTSVDFLLGRTDDPRPSGKPHDPSTPDWWYRDTPPSEVELEEFLKNANVHFNGAKLDDEDKEDIMTYLSVKWEREKLKREKEGRKGKPLK